MRDKVVASADAAVADIPDNVTIMFGGFAVAGTPVHLIRAVARRSIKGITGIANSGDRELDVLSANRQVKKMIVSFAIRATGSKQTAFERLLRSNEVEVELVPQGTLAERIRAGGAGIPAFYTPVGAGTVVAEGKEVRIIGGQECVLEYGLTADVALIRAQRADRWGNLAYHASGRNFNVPMATAARLVIAEVEEVVEIGAIDPEHVVTPGAYVDRVVVCPAGPVNWRP